ncbi:2-dehydro-3-deoxy-D-gluconate 5-dehydrogenase KduD [Marinilactibacillus kalidii]|uniref:2-dehydro-3-deoxy-D-gluconate 5-dehydrogenase KduD n=1 Tax=Marinilactibacillus kalidii TaxID=2820274 RepID=UPI001ABED393|nr:2-dehydro-3-deoxy-D-gluconate 5-dehydrogenase KduD [Marinilactibacillus kalidii]
MSDHLKDFSLDMFSLKGKVALVTGGNTGLGMGYVVALAKAGADVMVATFDNNVEEVTSLVEPTGVRLEFYQADLTKIDQMEAMVEKTVELFGKIDILVNNAGAIRRAPLLEYKDEDWQAVIDINQNSVYYLSQRVAKHMVSQGYGKIINIASMLSFQGGKFVPSYTASKHAVQGLTRAFANELAEHNVTVNAIAPGYFVSANTAPIRADEKRNKEIVDRIPAARWGDPSELMGTVVFLASPASDYVNGHVLAVDGGWLTR